MTTSAARQALGALCLAAVLVLLGYAIGGDVGEIARGAGFIAAIVGLVVLGLTLIRA
jgi:membrane protein DedA with SNARE-associated domain